MMETEPAPKPVETTATLENADVEDPDARKLSAAPNRFRLSSSSAFACLRFFPFDFFLLLLLLVFILLRFFLFVSFSFFPPYQHHRSVFLLSASAGYAQGMGIAC